MALTYAQTIALKEYYESNAWDEMPTTGNIELADVAFDGTITVRHGSKTFEITPEGRLVY